MNLKVIRPAQPSDAKAIAKSMRGVSVEEVERVGLDSMAVIAAAIKKSQFSWTGTIDGEIVCIWGVQTTTLLSDTAYLWLITTKLVEQNSFMFVRRSQIFIRELSQTYKVIHGYVDARFVRSIAWLKWLGFTVEPPDGSAPRLRHFTMSRK